jgi:hypothetical protein
LDHWLEPAGVLGLFLIRLGIPIAITVLVAILFRKLDRKWETEAAERLETGQPMVPGGRPCWIDKDCGPLRRGDCPAWGPRNIPCWVARVTAQGHLPHACAECDLFTRRGPVEPLPVWPPVAMPDLGAAQKPWAFSTDRVSPQELETPSV